MEDVACGEVGLINNPVANVEQGTFLAAFEVSLMSYVNDVRGADAALNLRCRRLWIASLIFEVWAIVIGTVFSLALVGSLGKDACALLSRRLVLKSALGCSGFLLAGGAFCALIIAWDFSLEQQDPGVKHTLIMASVFPAIPVIMSSVMEFLR